MVALLAAWTPCCAAPGGSAPDGGAKGEADAGTTDAGCYPVPQGLVSWWRGDGDETDSVGPNNATPVGTVSFIPGMVGQAFHFDGSSYVVAQAAGLPTGGSDRTIELWGRFQTSYPTTEGLFAGYGTWGTIDGTNEVLVSGDNEPANTFQFSQWGSGVADPTPLSENAWTHLAITESAGDLTIYVNGASVGSSSTLTVNTPDGGSLYLGGVPNPPDGVSEFLVGDVDEVSIYSRALDPAEIRGIYQAGSAGKCK